MSLDGGGWLSYSPDALGLAAQGPSVEAPALTACLVQLVKMTPVSGKDVRITPLRAVCVDVTVSFHCCVSFLGNKVAQTWGGGEGRG